MGIILSKELSNPLDIKEFSYVVKGSIIHGPFNGITKNIFKNYGFTIDWGDGVIQNYIINNSNINTAIVHRYSINKEYTITITQQEGYSNEDWLYPVQFNQRTPEALIKILKVPSNSNCWGVNGQNGICALLFYNTSNLISIENFNLPKDLTVVGNYFSDSLLRGSSLSALPSNFNLPQNLISVGDNFCGFMFVGSPISFLPSVFNLPQNLVSVEDNFCYNTFSNCRITSLPSGFNLPQNLTKVGAWFCRNMFEYSSLESIPMSLSKPLIISNTCSGYQLSGMFSNTIVPIGSNSFPNCAWY